MHAAESSAPLPGATAHPLAETNERSLPPLRTALGVADESGGITFSRDTIDQPYLLISDQNRIPTVIDVAEATDQPQPLLVKLHPASSIEIVVLHENGLPVADAQVTLSAQPYGYPDELPPDASGNPIADRPLWSDATDHAGRVTFTELPPGRYFAHAFHDHFVPYSSTEANKKVDLDGDLSISITLKDLYAVVYACPSDSPIVKTYWDTDLMQVELGHVVHQLSRARSALEERFPDSVAFVHRPRDPRRDVMIRCWAVTEDQSVWHGEWPMQPIRDINDPVFMEQEFDHAYRELIVELQSESGVPLPAHLRMYHQGLDISFPCVPGERQLLPTGTYSVSARRTTGRMREVLGDLEVVISESVPATDRLVITIDDELVPLSVRPELPGDDALTYLHFRLQFADGESIMVANWLPSQGDILLLVPPGPAQLECRSAAYENAKAEVEAAGDGTVLRFPLTVRSSNK